MKKINILDIETFEAEKIVKSTDSIIGYIDSKEVFGIRKITDFTPYSLDDDQQWYLPEPTESQLLGQYITDLEVKIMMLEVAANV